MSRRYIITSESVGEGHPDKVADSISDSVLDAVLAEDPNGRVACETLVKTRVAILAGEITTTARVDYVDVARNSICAAGYDDPELGFDGNSCSVFLALDRQSPDIAQGVNEGDGLDVDQGAGDQGLMYGYACRENEQLMPLPIHLAHSLTRSHARLRRSGELPWLRPDSKSQVSVVYENGRPVGIDTIVMSAQHAPDISHDDIKDAIVERIIRPVLPESLADGNIRYLINPTGRFVVGGPVGDCGLTGRKIVVDTYGGVGRHGGGAFSGKDPSKVDRSGAYMARHVAKNVVSAKSRRSLRSADRLRDWCCQTRVRACQHVRDRPISTTAGSRMRSTRCSTFGQRPSSGNWTCCGRFTPRRRPGAISAGRNPSSHGNQSAKRTNCSQQSPSNCAVAGKHRLSRPAAVQIRPDIHGVARHGDGLACAAACEMIDFGPEIEI